MQKAKWVLFLTMFSSFSFGQPTPPSTVVQPMPGAPLAIQIPALVAKIQAVGYPLVTRVELTDGIYQVKAINQQGLNIDLQVDPQTGQIIKPKITHIIRLTLVDAINKVQAGGYHGVYKAEAKSNGYYVIEAIDTRGSQVTLEVNAGTGDISKSWF